MNSVLDVMREHGVSKLVRMPGASPVDAWRGYGHETVKFSNREVQEAAENGDLGIQGNFAVVSKAVRDAEVAERRSVAARKASETRRNAPPSYCAERFLRKLRWSGGFVQPETWREVDAAKELMFKGLVLRAEFNAPQGCIKAYLISDKGSSCLEGLDTRQGVK